MVKTFVKITNEDIYKTIVDNNQRLEAKLDAFDKKNTEAHNQICIKQNLTNGKVKLNKWVSTTALAITLILLGFLFNHIGR